MSQFTVMKTSLREEATIPMLAIDAFHDAFRQASLSDAGVTYVKDRQLVQQLHGEVTVIQDLSPAYILPKLKRSVLKRKKKQEVLA
ncbi:hypothetical protein [Acinetobacter bereziniae]|uniref:hypothetical protein n=1 Tax=Acinetobacter bereziniae TaxID=106648 RepID=UPI00125ED7F7|nr:hypothetical protein [Acinetobacter bereziniae]